MCLIGDVVGIGYFLPHIPKRLTDIFSFWYKLQMIVEKYVITTIKRNNSRNRKAFGFGYCHETEWRSLYCFNRLSGCWGAKTLFTFSV